MGWQFLDPEDQIHMTPWMNSGKIDSADLRIDQIELPEGEGKRWNLWGWCVADMLKDRDGKQVKHYRSKPFELSVIAEEHLRDYKEEELPIKQGQLYLLTSCTFNSEKY